MKTKTSKCAKRRGLSLLELSVATAMLAVVATATMALVRTSYSAWSRQDEALGQQLEPHALQRHLVRQIRQAQAVLEISDGSDTSGHLSLLMPSGAVYVWDHSDSTKEVHFGVDSATSLLATNVQTWTLEGIGADAATVVTDVGLVHSIVSDVQYNLDRPSGTQLKTITTQAWIRSW